MKAKYEPAKSSRRLECLDGLRGLAAFVVVLDHFCYCFEPIMEARAGRKLHLLAVFDGSFAVSIFFVLSGFVLSRSVSRPGWNLGSLFCVRYLRLTIPMVVSLVYAWLLLHLFPCSRIEIQSLARNDWLALANVGAQVPGFIAALQAGLYQVYLFHSPRLNNVVWTMRYELFGSAAIYSIYRFCPPRFIMWSLFVFFLASFLQPWYLGFPIGCLLKELGDRGQLRFFVWNWAALALFIILLLSAHSNLSGHSSIILNTLSAGALLFSIITLPQLQQFLEMRAPLFLGRISFSLYLLHVPLIITLGPWLFLRLNARPYLDLLLTFLVFVGSSISVAWLMTIGVDEPLLRILRIFKKSGETVKES